MKKMLQKLTLSAFLVLLLGGVAQAIEVKKTMTVNAPMNDVWDKISAWCAIKDWHPAVVGCKETRKGEELRRTLTLDGGGEIVELLTGESERSYSYIIETSPLPVANYKSTISVVPDGEGKTTLTWVGNFDAKDKPDDEVKGIIAGIYDGGFASIGKMFP